MTKIKGTLTIHYSKILTLSFLLWKGIYCDIWQRDFNCPTVKLHSAVMMYKWVCFILRDHFSDWITQWREPHSTHAPVQSFPLVRSLLTVLCLFCCAPYVYLVYLTVEARLCRMKNVIGCARLAREGSDSIKFCSCFLSLSFFSRLHWMSSG